MTCLKYSAKFLTPMFIDSARVGPTRKSGSSPASRLCVSRGRGDAAVRIVFVLIHMNQGFPCDATRQGPGSVADQMNIASASFGMIAESFIGVCFKPGVEWNRFVEDHVS